MRHAVRDRPEDGFAATGAGTASSMTRIAFLGTGTMGLPMARNLLKAGFELRVWNRSADRARPLTDEP